MSDQTLLLEGCMHITADGVIRVDNPLSGVIVQEIETAAKDPRFAPYLKDVDAGLLIYVPPSSEAAIHYRVVSPTHERLVLVIDRESAVTFLEDYLASESLSGKVFVHLCEYSRLELFEIHRTTPDADVALLKQISCASNSRLKREVVYLGSRTSSVDTKITLDADATADNVELFFGSGEQIFRVNTSFFHRGLRSKGDMLIKGLLRDKAQFYSNAVLDIAKDAQLTDTFLAEHILLLDKEAKANVIPSLEIRANDVKASHAVSVSQIDHEHVFYLQCKGMSESEAQKMLVLGFLDSALHTVHDSVRREFARLFEEKWQ